MTVSLPSYADYTSVYWPWPGEESHLDIINDIYADSFAVQGSDLGYGVHTEYSNGLVTVYRVNDFGIEVPATNILTKKINKTLDKLWVDGIATVNVKAKFAAYSQSFGYLLDSGYVPLFDVVGDSFNVSGDAVADFPLGSAWQWVRSGTGHTFYSDPDNNSDKLDHMVTYWVDGLNDGYVTWLLFWEDVSGDYCDGSDRDFNDLVVEIKAIPEPISFLLLGAGAVLMRVNNKKHRLP